MAAGDPDDPRKGTEEERFQEEVRRKAERRMRSRSRQDEGVWHWLGMFGLVGWAVAIPTLLGVAVGCLHAWYWIRQERQRD